MMKNDFQSSKTGTTRQELKKIVCSVCIIRDDEDSHQETLLNLKRVNLCTDIFPIQLQLANQTTASCQTAAYALKRLLVLLQLDYNFLICRAYTQLNMDMSSHTARTLNVSKVVIDNYTET